MQKQILGKHPDADVKVYAIWFNMFPGDERAKWPDDLLTDSRVVNIWDEGKLTGSWYGANVTHKGSEHVEWDAFFLYDAGATWTEKGPTPLLSWGRTIVAAREKAER